jgi:hypothetical protein
VLINEFPGFPTLFFALRNDWQFDDSQNQSLQKYYDANRLLINCLNSDCVVSEEVRHAIEEALLLPIGEIEKRKCEKSE